MLAFFEKLFTPYTLIALNVAIILLVELVSDGTYFAETGLVHAIALVFVGLIIVRIFSEYSFSDYILKGFLRIQLAFFLFLGLVHVYEYLALYVFELNHEAVELSAMVCYFIWILGVILATEFVFRIYQKRSAVFTAILTVLIVACFALIAAMNISGEFAEELEELVPIMMAVGIAGLGLFGILSTRKIQEIMPVFKEYSRYAIPAIGLLFLTALAEYFESAHILEDLVDISDTQIFYFAHFFLYGALSLLFIAFDKLKRPKGIYEE